MKPFGRFGRLLKWRADSMVHIETPPRFMQFLHPCGPEVGQPAGLVGWPSRLSERRIANNE
jgi:hypothetical protein